MKNLREKNNVRNGQKKKKKMMYGGSARKNKARWCYNKMDRIGMAMGGAMDVQKPN